MSRIDQFSIALLVSIVSIAAPGALHSQDGVGIADGDRVRFTTHDGSITGVARFETDGLLFLEVEEGAAALFIDVERASLLEVSQGVGVDPSRVLPSLALGGLSGVAVGLPLWALTDDGASAGVAVLGGLALGLVSGLVPRERWKSAGSPVLTGGISSVDGRPALALRWRP